MESSTERKLQVIFDVHQFNLSKDEEMSLHSTLDALSRQVENFPIADLHVLIEGNARSNSVSVKLSLMLPGTTLVSTESGDAVQSAFEQCVDTLVENLEAYKARLGNIPERQKAEKGTTQEVHSTIPLDADELSRAVEAGDYSAFRTATFPLEEGLRKRIGRWVQRVPEVQADIGNGLEIADIVEDVFLMAFEGYENRPIDVPFGNWLENLIDPAIQVLRTQRGQELENIELVRAARAAEQGQSAGE